MSLAGTEVEWQFEAPDLRGVERWIEEFGAGALGGSDLDDHVDTYLDTKDGRVGRAGYSVRIRRRRDGPPEATVKSLAASDADGLRSRVELEEELEGDEPAAVARAPGPVGLQVRALVGSDELVPLFAVETRRRVFPLTVRGAPSGELLLDETAIREPGGGGEVLGRLSRVEVELPEAAVEAVRPLVTSLREACGLRPAELSKYEAALAVGGRAAGRGGD